MLWRVTLFNQHAMCGIGGVGKTRRAAFYAAFDRARPEFRHHGFVDDTCSGRGADVQWVAAFYAALDGMRRGASSTYHRGRRGMAVEIRRIVNSDLPSK